MTSLTARRCIVCDAEASKRCSSCAKAGVDLFFCSLEHFAKVWSGHKQSCGKASSFLLRPPASFIQAARELSDGPLWKTIVMRLIHLVWGSTKQDYRSLNGLRLRQSVKAIWGFDPAEPDDPGDEANEKACPASLAQELEEMTGMPAENLLDYLETLGEATPDLVPFRDVVVACVDASIACPSWISASERHMFYGKRSFDTMCAWMRRGMDLDDPQLAEVFADDIMAYTLIQQHLWPACDKPAAQAAPAQSKKTKKPKSGAAKLAQ